MIPDLAHRVSVFGLLKPAACRICFDVTLTMTTYVPVMSLSSEKDRDPPPPPADGGKGPQFQVICGYAGRAGPAPGSCDRIDNISSFVRADAMSASSLDLRR